MKVDIKDLPKSQIELTITLSPQEIEPYLDKVAQEVSKEKNFKGFRPGKVPRSMIEQEIGKDGLLNKSLDFIIRTTYVKTILNKKIKALGKPKIEVQKVAPDNDLIYKAIVAVVPEVHLGEYRKLKVKPRKIKEISSEQIDNVLIELQKSRANVKDVDREAKVGDKVEVDFKSFLSGVPIENGESKNHPVIIGEDTMVPGFEDNLCGMKKGEKKEFEIRFPKDFRVKSLADRMIKFKVEMNQVQRVELPKLDDKFIKSLGKFKDLKAVRAQIKNNLKKEARFKEEERLKGEVLEKIAQDSQVEISDVLIDSELDKMVEEYKNRIEMQGLKFESYLSQIGKNIEEIRKDWRPQAEKRIKVALIIGEISRREKIKIDDREINEQVNKLAQDVISRTKDTEKRNKSLQRLNSKESRDYLRTIIRNQKTVERLVKIATDTD